MWRLVIMAAAALACDSSWYQYTISCTKNMGCTLAGAYVPVVNTQQSATIVVYPSSVVFSSPSTTTPIAVPLVVQGTPLSMGVAYSNKNTTVTLAHQEATSACGSAEFGIKFDIDDTSAITINATTPFEAVVYIRSSQPVSTTQKPLDFTANEEERMAFSTTLAALSAIGIIIVAVAYLFRNKGQ